MIQTNRPVFAQEFDDVRNQAIIIALTHFVQVLDRQADERHKRWNNDLLTAEIRNVLD